MITEQVRTHHSLFDTIAKEDGFRLDFNRQSYSGTLDDVLTKTEQILISGDRRTHALQLALHAPRIIRALVDYKVQHPSKGAELLLRDAIKLGLDIYRGDSDALEELRELRKSIEKSGDRVVLQRALVQPSDPVTWSATHPSRSRKTARNLAAMTNSDNVLFVALAHGGTAAGMDSYLRYCNDIGNDGSRFYVVRFSTQKLRDSKPRITPAEITYLQEQANARLPVIFDEDSASGRTLEEASDFFAGTVFPFGEVITLTNLDARGELMSLGSGKQLAEMDKYIEKKDLHKYITELYKKEIIKENYEEKIKFNISPSLAPESLRNLDLYAKAGEEGR